MTRNSYYDDDWWDDDEFEDDEWEEERLPPRPTVDKPPIWPVFVTYVGALVAMIGCQLVIGVVILVYLIMNGENLGAIDKDLVIDTVAWPGILTALASVTQLIAAAAALIGAWFSREGFVKALGFGKSALPVYTWPIVALGAAAPGFLGVILAFGVSDFFPKDRTLEKTIGRVTWGSAVPFVLFISLTPGFVEEAFIRGYMQQRLLKRWSPMFAIIVSAALFAILHLDPTTIVFAFPLGVWLGVVAWRAGSIWPCIVTHAAWNASVVSWSIGEQLLGLPEIPPLVPSIVVGTIVGTCFLASIWLLVRSKPPQWDDDVPVAELTPE